MYLVGGAEAQQQPQQTICVPTAPRPRGAARLDPLSQFRPLISESALRPSRMFRFIMLCTLQAARMASLCEPLEKKSRFNSRQSCGHVACSVVWSTALCELLLDVGCMLA